MKKFKLSIIISLILMIITSHVITARVANVHALQKTSAEVVLCNSTGEVLYQKNENERVSIASLTKILTAITAIENYDLSREITITEDMVGVEGS
ncbi:MAG: D-alanyl-D-alanine carboxypeptidase, partial [Clostridia bacterium]|nr:D-alanyl-D-alanine carboxypeptidase [Clostridia bacterium]